MFRICLCTLCTVAILTYLPSVTCLLHSLASVTPSPPTANLLQGSGELVCLAFGFSPAPINITWLLDGLTELWNHSTSTPYRGPGGKFIVKSQLFLPAQDWLPGAVYTCRVTHSTITLTLNISKPGFCLLFIPPPIPMNR